MVNVRLCEKVRLHFFFASSRNFDFFDCETETDGSSLLTMMLFISQKGANLGKFNSNSQHNLPHC